MVRLHNNQPCQAVVVYFKQIVKANTKTKVNVRGGQVKASCECGKVRAKLISQVSRRRHEVSVSEL